MFEPGTPVVVAVSGGPDSLCLLHSLVRLRRLLRIRPVCFHFDHGLRPVSKDDARYVRAQAKRLGLEFLMRTAASRPRPGESVEAWARTERYLALFRAVEESGASAAAVGHNMDDQAETVLLALVRGGGLEALSGMAPFTAPVARPLLETTRAETEAFCRALRLRPRRDPMNEDPAFLRAAVRGQVIPTLEARLGRNIRPTRARTAELLRADAALLAELAADAGAEIVEAANEDERRLKAGALRAVPEPVASRVVHAVLMELGVVPQANHVESVLDLLDRRPGSRVMLPGALIARRDREYVRFLRPSPRE
jgi:tRNA(Ile)-lysidine synthase